MTAAAPVGANATRLWGLTAEERLRRIARAQGLEVREDGELLVNLGYAFDPSWLKLAAARPGVVVTRGGVPVLAHATAPREEIAEAMAEGRKVLAAREIIAWEEAGDLENEELRKKERPFMERLEPGTVRCARAGQLFRRLQGRHRPADQISVAGMGAGSDPLGGADRHDSEPGVADGGDAVRARHLAVPSGLVLARPGRGARLHGARHGRRQARPLHDHLLEDRRGDRPRHRPHSSALLVVGLGSGASRLRAAARRRNLMVDARRDRRRLRRSSA